MTKIRLLTQAYDGDAIILTYKVRQDTIIYTGKLRAKAILGIEVIKRLIRIDAETAIAKLITTYPDFTSELGLDVDLNTYPV